MAYQIVYTQEALENIDHAVEWWALNRNQTEAKAWYEAIQKQITKMRKMPFRFGLARENDEFPYELRELHFGLSSRLTHRVLFTIRTDMILVIAVLNSRQRELPSGLDS